MEAQGYQPYEYLDKSRAINTDFDKRLCDTLKSAIMHKGVGDPYLDQIKGTSKAVSEILRQSLNIAGIGLPLPVFITGESGTGKELIAQLIHYNSPRRNEPFVPINCAAIPESLVEDHLFGHEQGAFTEAKERRIGKFEEANRGTLFLDEIGEMKPDIQAKLLRAIQENKIERLGGQKEIKIDVRVIAATNRDIKKALINGQFREDLFYRLNTCHIHIPPLRERKEDIRIIAEYIFNKRKKEFNKINAVISDEAFELMENYDWPGNVRELQNAIERSLLNATGNIILPEHLKIGKFDIHSKDNTTYNSDSDVPLRIYKRKNQIQIPFDDEDDITKAILLTLDEILKEKRKVRIRDIQAKLPLYLPDNEEVPTDRKIGAILKKLMLYTKQERASNGFVYIINPIAVREKINNSSQ